MTTNSEEARAKEIAYLTEIASLKRDVINLEESVKIEKVKLLTTHKILIELQKDSSGCCR